MAVAYAFYQLKADGATPKVIDDPEYHPDVLHGVLPLAHEVSADGRSVRLGTPGGGAAAGPSASSAAGPDSDSDDDAW
mgnify:CR=1 FL=1